MITLKIILMKIICTCTLIFGICAAQNLLCSRIDLPKCQTNNSEEYQVKNCSGLDFRLSEYEINNVVKAHNKKRAMHRTPPLVLSEQLSDYSQQLANYLAKERLYWHTPEDGYGVNVWVSNWHHDFIELNPVLAVNYWYHEGNLFERNNYFELLAATMHYTQLLWKDSAIIGVGASKSSEDNWYVVCAYKPPGNIISKIRQNVLPLAHIQLQEENLMFHKRLVGISYILLILITWIVFMAARYITLK